MYTDTASDCYLTLGAKVLGIAYSFSRNEGSWTKVPQERKFQGAKVHGTFAPEERKFHSSESTTEQKFHGNYSSICGLFAPGNKSAEERKVLHSYTKPLYYHPHKTENNIDILTLILTLTQFQVSAPESTY